MLPNKILLTILGWALDRTFWFEQRLKFGLIFKSNCRTQVIFWNTSIITVQWKLNTLGYNNTNTAFAFRIQKCAKHADVITHLNLLYPKLQIWILQHLWLIFRSWLKRQRFRDLCLCYLFWSIFLTKKNRIWPESFSLW